jgi:hypothetical protein
MHSYSYRHRYTRSVCMHTPLHHTPHAVCALQQHMQWCMHSYSSSYTTRVHTQCVVQQYYQRYSSSCAAAAGVLCGVVYAQHAVHTTSGCSSTRTACACTATATDTHTHTVCVHTPLHTHNTCCAVCCSSTCSGACTATAAATPPVCGAAVLPVVLCCAQLVWLVVQGVVCWCTVLCTAGTVCVAHRRCASRCRGTRCPVGMPAYHGWWHSTSIHTTPLHACMHCCVHTYC